MSACIKLYHRSLWEKLRFPVGKRYEDAFVTYLIIEKAERIALTEAAMYYYFNNHESITHQIWSPKTMDQIQAHSERVDYWKNLGYMDRYCCELKRYIEVIEYQIELAQAAGEERYAEHIKAMLKLRKQAIAAAKKVAKRPFWDEQLGVYTLKEYMLQSNRQKLANKLFVWYDYLPNFVKVVYRKIKQVIQK